MPPARRGPPLFADPPDRTAELAARTAEGLSAPDVSKAELVRLVDELRRQATVPVPAEPPLPPPEPVPVPAVAVLSELNRRPDRGMSALEISRRMSEQPAAWGRRGSRNTVAKYLKVLRRRRLVVRHAGRRNRWQISPSGREYLAAVERDGRPPGI